MFVTFTGCAYGPLHYPVVVLFINQKTIVIAENPLNFTQLVDVHRITNTHSFKIPVGVKRVERFDHQVQH